MGDYSGVAQPVEPLTSRRFTLFDRDNINDVMARMRPVLKFQVENVVTGDRSELPIDLAFCSMQDFEPVHIARQVAPLRRLLEQRNNTTDSAALATIDALLTRQLRLIMHAPEFVRLEGSWRGLYYLAMTSETSQQLKLKVLNISKSELYQDLKSSRDFKDSVIWKMLYDDIFKTPGGEPYGALIGDYEFSHHPNDILLLKSLGNIAAGSFCPFISAASPQLFGLDSFSRLPKPQDLDRRFQTEEYVGWRAFRSSEDSRFVALTMPRVLSRLPYGSNTQPVGEFDFEELEHEGGKAKAPHEHFAWMSLAYVLGARLTDAIARWGWFTALRGIENGGKVEDLPTHFFKTDEGDDGVNCSTEIGISERHEAVLSRLGFIPACHFKNTDCTVFFSVQTTQEPRRSVDSDAATNARISASLPCSLVVSRIVHYLKVIARDRIGCFMGPEDCESWLNLWIKDYQCLDPRPTLNAICERPLAEAHLSVAEHPEKPGVYQIAAHLRPWLTPNLTAAIRVVFDIPSLGV